MRLLPLPFVVAALLLALPGEAAAAVKWLCKPGARDVCDTRLTTAVFSPAGQQFGFERPRQRRRKIDCFYVYPTVSGQPGTFADKQVDPEVRSIARFQAARWSQVCRVFAPVYRQRTLAGIATPRGARSLSGFDRGDRDVREAWRTYLRRYNKGRGVVLIGHSQGTFRLRTLIKREIDDGDRVHRRIVSALLLGGNVVKGEFNGFLPCRTPVQLRCVVAFSVYDETPPPGALFGRSAGGGTVVCTNPARLLGGSATVDAIYPSEPFAPGTLIAAGIQLLGVTLPSAAAAPWVEVEDGYRAECRRAAGATYLHVTPVSGAPDFQPSPSPEWGLHLVDANIALGDLLALVRKQAAAYVARRR